MTPGMALRLARIEAGIRQYDLAAELGVSSAFLSNVEKGHRRLPPRLLDKLPTLIKRKIQSAVADDLERQAKMLRENLERQAKMLRENAS